MTRTIGALDGFAALLVVYLGFRLVTSKRRHSLPPGPRGLPLIGNALHWPKVASWETFTKWGKTYGPVVYCNMLGKSIIILNTPEAIFELLDRRGAIYSDRPHRVLLDLAGYTGSLGSSQFGPRLVSLRRLVSMVGNKAGVERYAHVMNQERHRYLRRLLEDPNPEEYVKHLQTSSAAIIIDVCYGYDVRDEHDYLINVLITGWRALSQLLVPTRGVAAHFPFLRHLPSSLPGLQIFQDVKTARMILEEGNTMPLKFVKEQLAKGTARPSFSAEQLDNPDLSPEKEELIRWASAAVFAAGFETTTVSIYNFILSMMLHPEVQVKAQAELDAVVGSERLATLEDRAHLPYTTAVVKEVIRWITVAPIGVPHRSRQDDFYMGYYIPKDSVVIPNIFNILHDPETYKQPMTFNPERFLGEIPEPEPSKYAFGFGRRVCPGEDFAEASVFLHASAILSVFNITQAKGSSPIDRTDLSNLPKYPNPAPCVFETRSEAAAALINSIAYRGEFAG